jgi:hypothetical protein
VTEGIKMEPVAVRQDDQKNIFNKITSLLDQNIRGVQLGIYSLACGGLFIALWSVRPFKKFTNPRQIPSSFFEKHITLSGKVLRIDFNPSPFLVVDHSPIIGKRFRHVGTGLHVKLGGVNLSTNGISWLQTLIVGQEVNFTLLQPQHNYVDCIVEFKNKNIANTLVSLGFASVDTFNNHLENDVLYKKYYQSLLKEENRAERKGAGMWWDRQQTLSSRLLQLIFSKLPMLNVKI